MAFQTGFEVLPGKGYTAVSYGFDNFVNAWKHFTTYTYRIKNTLIFFAVNFFIDIPLAILSSYYFYRNRFASGFFKVMLFLPQIISAMVFGVLYRFLVTDVYQAISGAELTLMQNPNTATLIVIVFNLIMSFGVNVLVYSSALSGINESLIESASIDGASPLRTFFSISLPLIWPTLATMSVMAFSFIFVEQWQVYTIYGGAPNIYVDNIGYDLFYHSINSTIESGMSEGGYMITFPVLSAYGIILTAIILPLTILFRKLLDKFGPSTK